jgi:hypothetical protein
MPTGSGPFLARQSALRLVNPGGFDKAKPRALSKLCMDKLTGSSDHKKARLLRAGLLDS